MKAKCPKCNSDCFITTAHVAQTWVVDSEGHFIKEISTDDVTHGPNPDNEWVCEDCGSVAEVES